jgi:hypothetical protein
VRRLTTLALLLLTAVLLLPGAAPAKSEGALRVCGQNGCRTIPERQAAALLAEIRGRALVGPSAPAPFYTLTHVVRTVHGDLVAGTSAGYYVPRADVTRDAGWRPPAWRRAVRGLRSAARRLEPFRPPRIVRVEIDGRPAHTPSSYVRLFALPRPAKPISDPAGPQPRGDPSRYYETADLIRYWRRVRRHWLPVNIWTARPSPWGDDETSVWVGRRRDLVNRDGEIVRVPHSLAERIRRGERLG